ncbi:MAG: RecQ family ATP-dependent DNA helicase [Flavobacteriaceae bacterium]|nr:RecQ family ATP-dependent DNA helicase [Flavobacteriaceae bacterium]
MESKEINLHDPLKKYFGFDKFRGVQEEIIKSIITGNDTFVIMPTGGGKSMCYQLPALILDGVAIIVSPLIALMKNQVDAIRSATGNDKIAHVLNSSLNKGDVQRVKDDIMSGVTKMIYVAPESLIKEEYVEFLQKQNVSFVAIDEAHCISEWGHDFRPEYRNLKNIITEIKDVAIIGLTATATPKVQEDIMKTLGMVGANMFQVSFNRPNLYYQVEPKTENVIKDIILFIRQNKGKSGIIYCLSRKKVEEITQSLQVNGIKAVAYHAGFDPKTRARHQDMFLMEDIDIVVATIAFGMGIDKPNVRFVIHHDIPKSLESYYQETGRAGRDGGEGHCLAFYNYKDIEKLEKFIANKPVSEQEIGMALIQDVVGYCETSVSRRKYILHYFGEYFDEVNGLGADMDDNTKFPKNKVEAKEDFKLVLDTVVHTKQKYKMKDLCATLTGVNNALLISHKTNKQDFFGKGKHKEADYWKSLIRQSFIGGYTKKEIEQYGVLKLTDKGQDFIDNPVSFMMTEDSGYDQMLAKANGVAAVKTAVTYDKDLMSVLKKLQLKVAKKHNVPPYVIFQETSLQEMSGKYPTSLEELSNIQGVGMGKANKYGKEFVEEIKGYTEKQGITVVEDIIVKTTGEKSGLKLYIIQNTDRKLPLEDISKAKGLSITELITAIEKIVFSGTKINVNYYLNDILDEEQQEEIMEYFMESETDSIDEASQEFDGDYEDEELRLMRIKFISEVAN